jgi:uncharacterized cupredoxin-like copper-binding protein
MRRFALIAPFAVAALIAGCGSSSSSSSSASTSSTPAAAPSSSTTTSSTAAAPATSGGGSSSVKLSETEFKITPKTPAVAKVGPVTFDVTNNGSVTHALAVESPAGLKSTASIAPGKSATLTVDFTKAGTYTFYCPVDNHKMLGMIGTITVGSGGGGGSASSAAPATTTSSSGGSTY